MARVHISGARSLLDDRKITARALRAAERGAMWTAADVRSGARRLIKSGGKNPASKSYKVSKPGEAPRSHVGTLKQAIRYEKSGASTYVVGPEKAGSGNVLKALEYGGKTTSRAVYATPGYFQRVSGGANGSSKRGGRNGRKQTRPRAARPYVVASEESPRGVVVRNYRYFYSRDAWERARNAAAFQTWGQSQKVSTAVTRLIQARPYMSPALAAAVAAEKARGRWLRALK